MMKWQDFLEPYERRDLTTPEGVFIDGFAAGLLRLSMSLPVGADRRAVATWEAGIRAGSEIASIFSSVGFDDEARNLPDIEREALMMELSMGIGLESADALANIPLDLDGVIDEVIVRGNQRLHVALLAAEYIEGIALALARSTSATRA